MAYDEAVASRVRRALAAYPEVAEIRMFGGLCFTIRGHMCCGVLRDDLVVRIRPERHAAMLAEPHVRPMDFTGRPFTGLVYVAPRGYATPAALRKWVRRGADLALSLPPKAPRRPGRVLSPGPRRPGRIRRG